jgi:hypothetical protein
MNNILITFKDLLSIDDSLYELRDALDNYNVPKAKVVLEDIREKVEYYIGEIEEIQKEEEGE